MSIPMNSCDLPSNIIFEILTRTSLQTLGKCRLVCMEWNHITYKSSFMRLHCERTKTISGYFIQSMFKNKYHSTFMWIDKSISISCPALDFLPSPVKIEASSNLGILCCVSENPQSPRNLEIPQYYVCKPSTKQWQVISNPKTRYFTERIAMMVLRLNPLYYKIVRFSQPNFRSKKYHNLRCEIFDSKIWAWKDLKEVQLPYHVLLSHQPAVLASGTVHWLTTHNHIFSFNMNQEIWSMFALPEPLKENDHYKKLVEFEGRLALTCMGREESVELWVMKDYGNQVWNKTKTLSIEAFINNKRYTSLAAFYNSDIALMKGYDEVMFCKFQNCSPIAVKLEKHTDPGGVFAFRSDLEPSCLMGRN